MKTIKKGEEVVRVTDEEAIVRVKNGFSYCKKTEWKKVIRDKGKVKVEVKNPKSVSKGDKSDKVEEVKAVRVDTRSEVDSIVEGTGESRSKNAGLEKYRAKKNRKASK